MNAKQEYQQAHRELVNATQSQIKFPSKAGEIRKDKAEREMRAATAKLNAATK